MQTEACNSTLIADHLQLYVDLERTVSVSFEKELIEAYRTYPDEKLDIKLYDS